MTRAQTEERSKVEDKDSKWSEVAGHLKIKTID